VSEPAPEEVVALKRVASGLGLVFATIALLFLSVTGLAVLSLFQVEFNEVPALVLGFLLLWIFLTLLNATGQVLCLQAPFQANARSLAVGSLAATVLTLVFLVAVLVNYFLVLLPDELAAWLILPAIVSALAAQILFVLFLRKLADYVGAGEQEGQAEILLVWWLIEVLLLAAAPVLIVFCGVPSGVVLEERLPVAWQVYYFAVVLLSLAVFVMDCSLITGVRDSVLRYVALAPEEEDE
jgi:hypothetical protein